jgi:hypothetical protein
MQMHDSMVLGPLIDCRWPLALPAVGGGAGGAAGSWHPGAGGRSACCWQGAQAQQEDQQVEGEGSQEEQEQAQVDAQEEQEQQQQRL